MKNDVTFGKWEAFCFLVNLMNTQIFLNFPRTMVESAGTAGWMLVLYLTALVFVGFFLITRLYKPFEGMDLIDICEKATGGIGRVIVGLILTGYLFFIISVVLREFGEDMKTITLSVSPISYIILFFIVGMVIGAYFGLEAIVRFSAISVPIILAGYFFILIAVAPYYDIQNLTPVFGSGLNAIFIRSAPKISVFSATIILFLITPFIKTNKNMKSVGYLAIGTAGFNFLVGTLVYIMVYPYPAALENFLPVYQLARLINYGRFFQRVESVFVFIWASGALLYLSAGFFLIINTFKKTFKLKYYRPLIMPFAILVFNISLLPSSLMETIRLETVYFRNYIWIVTFGVPFLVLLVARLRMKSFTGGKKSSE